MKFYAYEKGDKKSFGPAIFPFFAPSPYPVINDQSPIVVNFDDLFLLSPSEIKRELCKLMTNIGQGIDRYKVPVVGKNGKLYDTIEVSAWWSNRKEVSPERSNF